MNCRGKFVFKTITYRESGTFKDDEGAEIKYPAAYILKVDEINDKGEINERKFKVPEDKTVLINTLKDLRAYDQIILEFKLTLYATKTNLELIDVETNVEDF